MRNRLELVRLEDRAVPATFTVTVAADSGNNAFPDAGSLREAILKANAAPGADTIAFNIPGAGVRTIAPTAALPPVTDAVTLDGTTQPGFAGTPVIRLSGTAAGAASNGLNLVNHSGSTVKGFTVGGFTGAGVRVSGGGSHTVTGNFFGTSQNGTAQDANLVGVLLTDATNGNTVGGTGAARNLLSGNTQDGVRIDGKASQNSVIGNYIGTDVNGANAVANGQAGVRVAGGATGTLVGGFAAGAGNVIAGNAASGVVLSGGDTAGNTVAGNRIGVNVPGNPLPNSGDGVRAENALGTTAVGIPEAFLGTTVRSNTIQFNSATGVAVRDTSRLVFLEANSIANNGSVGIAVDATAQNGIQPPVITGVSSDADGNLTITGTVTGTGNTAYGVQFFSNSAADPTGSGEGQNAIAATTVTTDVGGNGSFSVTTTGTITGLFVAAYAVAPQKDTSAYSNAFAAPNSPVLDRLFAVGLSNRAAGRVYRGDATAAYDVTLLTGPQTASPRVAMADFNRDGVPDVLAGGGPGAVTQVRVLDGKTQAVLFTLQPFESGFTGGVYVAAGDINGDAVPDLIITPDEGGGPRVDVYSGVGFGKFASFFGIDDPNFRGGARPAAGDINGDGRDDLIVAAGFLGGPRVAGFTGQSVAANAPTRLFGDFFAFEQTLRNGIFVAAADLDGDGKAELIAGGGPGGGPRVTAFGGAGLIANDTTRIVANFFAGDPNSRGGVRVAGRDLNADGRAEIITGAGPGSAAQVNAYSGLDLTPDAAPNPRLAFDADPGQTGGIFVG